jgi:hypothetical protein
MFCRAIIPLCREELGFRSLAGSSKAFPEFQRVFGFGPLGNEIAGSCREALKRGGLRGKRHTEWYGRRVQQD